MEPPILFIVSTQNLQQASATTWALIIDQWMLTLVISADLQGPVSPHEQANGALLFVFQQLHVPGSPLLPLWGVVVRGEAVELGPPGGGEGNRQERRLNGFLPLSMHLIVCAPV